MPYQRLHRIAVLRRRGCDLCMTPVRQAPIAVLRQCSENMAERTPRKRPGDVISSGEGWHRNAARHALHH